jgi:hypothetical protein
MIPAQSLTSVRVFILEHLLTCNRSNVQVIKKRPDGYLMEIKPPQLRVLIMRREDWWVAQCLEFDLAAQAHGTFDNIKAEFCRMLGVRLAACRVEEIDPFKLPPASEIYNDISKRARPQIIFGEESDMALAFMLTDF